MQKNKGSCNSLLAIDATETPIERIKKTKIIIDINTNKVISTAFCYGSIHDYKLFLKSNTFINPNKKNSCRFMISRFTKYSWKNINTILKKQK